MSSFVALRSYMQTGEWATNLHTGLPAWVMGRNPADTARLRSK